MVVTLGTCTHHPHGLFCEITWKFLSDAVSLWMCLHEHLWGILSSCTISKCWWYLSRYFSRFQRSGLWRWPSKIGLTGVKEKRHNLNGKDWRRNAEFTFCIMCPGSLLSSAYFEILAKFFVWFSVISSESNLKNLELISWWYPIMSKYSIKVLHDKNWGSIFSCFYSTVISEEV